jgi:uncharacterized membrane-anchored protein
MSALSDHPQRATLNDEVHARPPEALVAPLRITFLALHSDWSHAERQREQVIELARRYGVAPPRAGDSHYSADLGPFRIKWERHTEFARYKFIVAGAQEDPFADPAIAAVPADWVGALAGQVLVATHAVLVHAGVHAGVRAGDSPIDHEALSQRRFGGNTLVGGAIAGGLATALTDLRIHADGYGRLWVADRGMTPRQAGRMLQRLFEMDSYRMLALLALPVARQLAPFLGERETELAHIAVSLAGASQADQTRVLERLIALEADIERRLAQHHYRFSAARAYHELVQRRIAELREERIQGLQTFQEFTERRLAPAMSTCSAAAARLESLSQRVARATQLLSTRVDIALERQNAAVLESMNRRAMLQLRLQETVEGLSVAAVTYYIVGLVGYVARALKAAGMRVNAELVMGIAIPLVVLLVALGVRNIRRAVTRGVSGA